MMHLNRLFCSLMLFISLMMLPQFTSAQSSATTVRNIKIGIFAPLYLDSVIKNGNFQYAKKFPRFVVPALDFVQGAQIALDSMPLYNVHIDAHVYDSKSQEVPVSELISSHALDSLELMIGSVKDEEYTQLAAFALEKHIPFISATYPNDGGITANPYLIILNTTLRAHCEAIQQYLETDHKSDNIILVKKTGTQEDRINGYFSQLQSADWKPAFKLQTFHSDSNFVALKSLLDSNKTNTIIGASLDEEFAGKLAVYLKNLPKKYSVKLIGMPNWETFGTFLNPSKSSLGDFPVYVTASYFNTKIDNYSKAIQDVYLSKYKGKPSDFAYKGFDAVFVFSKLLAMYGSDFTSHLNDYAYKIFTDYRFKPVYINKKGGIPDYFENKHVYLLKIQDGNITRSL